MNISSHKYLLMILHIICPEFLDILCNFLSNFASIAEVVLSIHKPKRKPNGITKADREARKSDDLRKMPQ